MAAIESKRSLSTAQGRGKGKDRRRAHAATKPAITTRKRRLPALPKPKVSKDGKTTITRFPHGRTFYRFEEIKGKTVDFVQFFTVGEYHSLDLRFQDKTTLHFVIEPGFTLETEHASVKTGNWRCLKRWPEIRSARC